MHPEILETNTRSVLSKVSASGIIDGFYLVGGTAYDWVQKNRTRSRVRFANHFIFQLERKSSLDLFQSISGGSLYPQAMRTSPGVSSGGAR